MIANVVADVEYHIPVPGIPVSNSNLRRGTRTINPTVQYEDNLENNKYSDSEVPVSGTEHMNIQNNEDPL